MIKYVSTGKIDTIVTYLEMKKEPKNCAQPPVMAGVDIQRLKNPTIPFYRFLYDQVGSPWNWTGRKLLSDSELQEKISAENVEIFVLYYEGSPAGYVEFEIQDNGKDVEIVYFGLFPNYIGCGLGRYLMTWSIWYVWKKKVPLRLWVHTCSLDGANALPTYLKAGFIIYDEKQEQVDVVKTV